MRRFKFTMLFSVLVLLWGTPELWAQSYTFKVLASSGKSTLDNDQLTVGKSIPASASIKVESQSYLSLVHKSGGTVEIGKAGTYNVNELEKELLARAKQSTSQRYANYIIGELTKAGDKDIHKNPYKYQNVTGSVERGQEYAILMMLPEKSPLYVFPKEYTLQWLPVLGASNYQIQVLDVFDEPLLTQQTSDTSLESTLVIPNIAKGN
ncbi:MAG: hypothetical protein HC880_21950 [Bacteroidia bacterium]|nr:hypothetical protein [Bacteroidia bacterium]